MQIVDAVANFLRRHAIAPPANRILVAFSGGPDSTALLLVLLSLAKTFNLKLRAAHLDHATDPESAARRRRACDLAHRLGVPIVSDRRSALSARTPGESIEATARRVRYGYLEECAERLGAQWIATAHHADDQRETIVLRILFGTGIAGLAGIPSARGRIIRPLLGVGRSAIDRYLEGTDVTPIEDPTNRHLTLPRNHVRHRLLPALRAADPGIDRHLVSLAEAAGAAVPRIDQLLLERARAVSDRDVVSMSRKGMAGLPGVLQRHSIEAACRLVGAPPPGRAALSELERQLALDSRVGCDLGGGWRVDDRIDQLVLARAPTPTAPFAYTLKVPGELRLPELSLVFRLTRCPTAPWMFRGCRRRAGMSLSLSEGDSVTIRSRRPGDRLQPLGSGFSRRLKEILIDRKMPKEERDRLPLLCVGETIVWVPGVTIDESVRLGEARYAWVAEIEKAQESTT